MRHFPWDESVWQPSEESLRATRNGEAYSVLLAVFPADFRRHLWRQLAAELTPGDAGLLDGGVVLRCVGEGEIEVTSGGEDVLDSLSYSLNSTIAEAAQHLVEAPSLQVKDEYLARL